MENQSQIETLNELLKGEHMAIRVYNRTKGIQQDSQVAEKFTQFELDHQRHADQLTQRIIELEGKPEAGTGLAGVMADVTSVINTLRGPEQLLEQIYDGEDKGIHAYEDRIDEIDPLSQNMVRQIMKEDHEHLKWFKARMEEEKSERN